MDPVLVAGAGPGGLTLALALRACGHDVVVLEQAPTLRTAGAGLTVQANAMRMLEAVGRADAVREVGAVLLEGRVEGAGGAVLQRIDLRRVQERFGQPSVAVHRADLSQVLARSLPEGTIRFDARVEAVAEDPGGVTVTLGTGESLRGVALVGCDGIHSRVREAVVPSVTPRYAGYTCWRGIADVPPALAPGHTVEWWGRGLRFGLVPIGGERSYWFATQNAPAGGVDGDDVMAALLERFGGLPEPVRAVLEATRPEAVLRNDIIDLPPLDRWVSGRVALLGDAAHAMTPNLGQGACQAIEDAVVLASVFAPDDVAASLRAYEGLRIRRAREMVVRSDRMGRVGQLENPVLRGVRDLGARLMPAPLLARALDGVYGVAVPPLATSGGSDRPSPTGPRP